LDKNTFIHEHSNEVLVEEMCCFETCTFLPESTWVIIHKLRACPQGYATTARYSGRTAHRSVLRLRFSAAVPGFSFVGRKWALAQNRSVNDSGRRRLNNNTIGDGSAGNVLFVAWLSSIVEDTGDANSRMHTHRQKHMARVDTVRSLCAFVGAASEQQRRWNGVDAYDEKQASNKCSPANSTT
jgi:hypothetical protein